MKTLAELNAALALATNNLQYMRTLTGAAETFAGDGIGFGTLGNAISLGIIVTNGRNDFIDGAGGNDTIRGYGGSDILVSGAGNDYLFGGPGSYGSNFSVDTANFLFGDTESVDPTVT